MTTGKVKNFAVRFLAACAAGLLSSGAVANPEPRTADRSSDGRPLKVLMIGNSFSKCNLGEMLNVAAAMGKRLAKFGFDQAEMYARLHAAYGELASRYSFDVIPVGTAAERVPNRNALFKQPDFHFGREGVYLQGLAFTAKLYGVDVGKCLYKPKWMKPSRAEEIKAAVMSAINAANSERAKKWRINRGPRKIGGPQVRLSAGCGLDDDQ